MCENVQYWMKLYVARVIKGGLIAVVASFLLFECSDESSKMGNKMDNPDNPNNPDNPDNPNNPDNPVIGKVILSEDALAFDDTAGSTGGVYTISLSQDLVAGKEVQITLTSDTAALQISPETVTFTETTGKAAQTITVKRASDASDVIVVDITGVINHTIASVVNSDPNITTFQDGSTVDVTVSSTFIADANSNGLIEIYTAEMFNNMRYDLAGTSYKTLADKVGDSSGCPASGCKGYELKADIDLSSLLDANKNGDIDTMSIGIDTNADGDTTDTNDKQVTVIDTTIDRSWMPIGDSTNKFMGIFEGNKHTIANLWVNSSFSRAGLFGRTGGTVEIRNVGVISGSVHSSSVLSVTGGLVGQSNSLTIMNSYFSGSGGVSSSSSSSSSLSYLGGLVGQSSATLTIVNSYFSGSGGVSSTSFSSAFSGGLVGTSNATLTIMNSYFSGLGGISSSVSSTFAGSVVSRSGGLVGHSVFHTKITSSYFSGLGEISSFASSTSSAATVVSQLGGLTGLSSALTVTNSYWNTTAPQSVSGVGRTLSLKRAQGNAETNPSGATGLTLAQLQDITGTHPSGLPHSATDSTKAWDLGTDEQLPAIKRCVSPTVSSTNVVTCASYGALLAGQR